MFRYITPLTRGSSKLIDDLNMVEDEHGSTNDGGLSHRSLSSKHMAYFITWAM